MAAPLRDLAMTCGILVGSRMIPCVGGNLFRDHGVPMETALAYGFTQTAFDVQSISLCYYIGKIGNIDENYPLVPKITFVVLYVLTPYVTSYLFNKLDYHLPRSYLSDVYYTSQIFSIFVRIVIDSYA
ncbi:MAG: hypothetical protein KDK69_02405 [Chlamydiia bacterium]|nr:hypothetical protein [Chlamydiia bacterium]